MLGSPISVRDIESEVGRTGNINDDLKRARAKLARYRVWHLAQTVPLRHGTTRLTMFETDTLALGDYLETLMDCYEAAGLRDGFPQVLDRLSKAIDSKEWTDRIIYQRALWAWNRGTDDDACRAILNDIHHIDTVRDPSILALYLQLMKDPLGFEQCQKIASTIVKESKEPSWRLKYRALMGILLFEIGDSDNGLNEVRAALEQFESTPARRPDWYGRLQHGYVLQFLGTETQDKKLLQAAQVEFEAILENDSLALLGRADLLHELGRVAIAQQDYARACQLLSDSNVVHDNPLNRIHQAEALLYAGDNKGSQSELEEVDWDVLTEDARFAFCSIYGHLALRMNDSNMMDVMSQRLRHLVVRTPRLREVRDQLRIALLEATHETSKAAADTARAKVAELLDTASSLLRAVNLHETSTLTPINESPNERDTLVEQSSRNKSRPSGPVSTKIEWKAIDDEAFESLVFDLVVDTHGYENRLSNRFSGRRDRGERSVGPAAMAS